MMKPAAACQNTPTDPDITFAKDWRPAMSAAVPTPKLHVQVRAGNPFMVKRSAVRLWVMAHLY
jgi:hypothetical protein